MGSVTGCASRACAAIESRRDLDERTRRPGNPQSHVALRARQLADERAGGSGRVKARHRPNLAPGEGVAVGVRPGRSTRVLLPVRVVDGAVERVAGGVDRGDVCGLRPGGRCTRPARPAREPEHRCRRNEAAPAVEAGRHRLDCIGDCPPDVGLTPDAFEQSTSDAAAVRPRVDEERREKPRSISPPGRREAEDPAVAARCDDGRTGPGDVPLEAREHPDARSRRRESMRLEDTPDRGDEDVVQHRQVVVDRWAKIHGRRR